MRAALVLLTILISGCTHFQVERGETPARPVSATTEWKMHAFIFGMVPGRQIPAEPELCPSGRVETVDMKMSKRDVLVAVATFGIYVPHRVTIGCSRATSAL